MKVENTRTMDRNREMTVEIMDLTKRIRTARDEGMKKSRFHDELQEAVEATENARRRCRILKSVVSATIAGSGVDWARDETLQSLVLNDEEG